MSLTYAAVTETPELQASSEQRAILYSRYKFASQFCQDKDVLEVACGSGLGLGFLGKFARKVVGGDIDEQNFRLAWEYYQGRSVQIQKFDAHELPFADHSFDVVLLYEAIYYLHQPEQFFQECQRVLRVPGILLITTVNREWTEFHPSPLSTRYFSVEELEALLVQFGFHPEIYGAFPVNAISLREKGTALLKRVASSFHLIPKTMKGKEFLKKIFFGKLSPLPAEVYEGMAEYHAPIRIGRHFPMRRFKVIYALGRKERSS